MVKIIINEFKGYDRSSFNEFILLQQETEFEIIIPRFFYDPANAIPELLADEFMVSAYAGELLNKTVTNFSYNVPFVLSDDPVIFQVQVEDTPSFIATLYRITKCAINDGDDVDSFMFFYEEACTLLQGFNEGGIFSVHGLLGAAFQLLYRDIKIEEEDDDDNDGEEAE